MSVFEVVILSALQGVTEFLPVSSDGHLVAARVLLGFNDTGSIAFDAWLHLGTLLAVLVYFRQVWWGLVRGIVVRDAAGSEARELLLKLAVATVPGAAVGFFLRNSSAWLHSPKISAAGFLITALALVSIERSSRRTAGMVSVRDAWLIGLAQTVALVPGISRSGMTIAAGCARGLSRQQATVFSFLMSAPIVAGAVLVSIPALMTEALDRSLLLVGAVVSFLTGLVAISVFLRLIQRLTLTPFVIYLVCLAGVLWWYA